MGVELSALMATAIDNFVTYTVVDIITKYETVGGPLVRCKYENWILFPNLPTCHFIVMGHIRYIRNRINPNSVAGHVKQHYVKLKFFEKLWRLIYVKYI